MPNAARLLIVAGLTLAAMAPRQVEGQGLTPGTWSGSFSNPAGQVTLSVTYDVGGTVEAPTVSMSVSMVPEPIPFNDIRLDGQTMTFWWEPGVRVDCTLTRDASGGYAGACSDGSGSGEGRLTMVPPDGQ